MKITPDNCIGLVVQCSNSARFGVITGYNNFGEDNIEYLGIDFDGSRWQSTKPHYLASNIDGYIDQITY